MTVFKPSDLKPQGVDSRKESFRGELDLYDKGYNLEIEHMPTGYKVKFPAYLENFSDAFTQSWNAEDVYGRMDPIAIYQNTRRAIAMSWAVPANSFEQAKKNMDLINVLMSFMYPSYQQQGGQNQGAVLNMSPLLRVKFVNLIHNAKDEDKGLLGYVNGFTVDVRSENGMFMDDATASVYPKTVTLNFELNVLHEHLMGWTTGKQGDPVLRESKNGFPYRTTDPVPSSAQTADSTNNATGGQNENSSAPGGGRSGLVLQGPGGSGGSMQ